MEQQIDKFLLGQMSFEEESLFLQECKINEELKEEIAIKSIIVTSSIALLVKTLKQTTI